MNILVIGYGVSGKAASSFLKSQGHFITVVDKKPSGDVLSDSSDLSLESFDQVILSPGISPTHRLVQKALACGKEVIGEIELGFKYLHNRCFGVTGSNGKTTTVTLTTHILNSANKKAKSLGNVGDSVTSYLLNPNLEDILIIELSSFQLEALKEKKLEAAIILNITPNHLDRHNSMEEYVRAKANIQNCLKPEGQLYVSRQVLKEFDSFFSNPHIFETDVPLIKDLELMGLMMPSKQSIDAAYLICKRCGVTDVDFLKGLRSYKKPAHRIEWVAKINGVSYYNDSKSSNIHSVVHAIERMDEKVILIVGGMHKGSSYKPWIEAFQGKVSQIIAYGKAAPIIDYELSSHFPLIQVDRFADAIRHAKQLAKEPEAVLLSPGCSSYDQFENYEQRGDEFKRLVREE